MKHVQAEIHKELSLYKYPDSSNFRELLRTRLTRWELEIPLGRLVERVVRRSLLLSGKVSPSVHAVYMRTLLNGWVTGRRVRSLINSNVSQICILCEKGRDSIEHLPGCSVVKSFYTQNQIEIDSLASVFGLDKNQFPNLTPSIAILLAAIYLARNAILHAPINFFQPLDLIIQMHQQIQNAGVGQHFD